MNNYFQKKPKVPLKTFLLIIAGLISLISTIIIALVITYNSRDAIMQKADARLLSGSEFLYEFLGSEYHNRIAGAESVTEYEYRYIVDRNDDLCRRVGFHKLWSVLVLDDQIVFTSATRSDKNDPGSVYASFFEKHHNPDAFFKAFGEPGVPVYSTVSNELGESRMLLVPHLDAHGRRYIFGASIQLAEFYTLIKNAAFKGFLIAVTLFVFLWLVLFAIVQRFTGVYSNINTAARQITAGDMDVVLPRSHIAELNQVCETLDTMRVELKERIKKLAQREILEKHKNEILLRLAQGEELKKLLDEVVLFTEHEDPTIRGSVLLLDPENQILLQGSAPSLPADYNALMESGLPIGPNAGSCGTTAFTREITIAADIQTDPRWTPYEDFIKKTHEHDLRACWSMPILSSNGDVLGVFANYSNQIGEPSLANLDKLKWAVSIAAIAIETKRAKDTLRDSEERYRTIISVSDTGAWEYHLDKNYVWCSSEFFTMLGLDPEQFVMDGRANLSETWLDLMHPDDRERVMQHFVEYLKNDSSGMYEDQFRMRHTNGSWLWIWTRGSKLYNPDGSLPNKIVGTNNNITGRKKNEENLLKSEARNKALLEAIPDLIFVIDKEGYWVDFQSNSNYLLLMSPEDFIGRHITETLPADIATKTLDVIKDIFSIKQMQEYEYQLEFEGELRHFEARTVYINNEQALIIVRDVTKRKGLEESLKYQTNLHKLLMEISSGFINIPLQNVNEATYDALGKMAMFVSADRSYTFDYDWENFVCNNVYEWCSEGISPQIDKLQGIPLDMAPWWIEAHQKGEALMIEDVLALDETDGARQIFEDQNIKSLLAVPMMNEDKCIGFVGFDSVKKNHVYTDNELHILGIFAQMLTNIKLRKEMVEQLVSARTNAEESDRLKSAFLANMSHEIRTPMNGILGFADLLKKTNLSDEKQQKYIRIIEKSGVRMLNIINDIIDVSKIESGLMELDIKESNINEQIDYLYTFFKPEAETKNIKLSFKTPLPQKEATIRTDREKVYAILTNMIKNALKFTHEGSIEFGYSLKTDTMSGELVFYVKDTGIGIPKDRQKAIFERFIQADITDKMAKQGTGLGLAISSAYVELLGGKIWLESKEGKGSTFYFTVPYNNEPVTETIDRQLEPSGQNDDVRKLKILMVEDDEISEMLLDETVNIIGKEILKARTGVEAVEACRSNPDIDLILMDIQIPEMGGYEATKQIRKFNKEIIIIAQTAYGLAGDREKSIESGCNDYIAKPINKNELLTLIQKYFGK